MRRCSFNTQPPEGGWRAFQATTLCRLPVSTHSRPKAAGTHGIPELTIPTVSTHSRPKAAGLKLRPMISRKTCFNTQPPEGGWAKEYAKIFGMTLFQHTAARRRLGRLKNRFYKFLISFNTQPPEGGWGQSGNFSSDRHSFNTQPPEGGWLRIGLLRRKPTCFNTQPPEGGWFLIASSFK